MNRVLPLLALCGALLGLAACGDDNSSTGSTGSSGGASTSAGGGGLSGQLAGAGSSAQEAAQAAWTKGFQEANSGASVSYDPVGSGGGREQFVSGGVAFAGSDSALADDELTGAQKRCGGVDNLVEVPAYLSPIAIAYNLSGVDKLQLSPDTVAKIFHGDITKWDDPAIKADNPGVNLPGDRLTVVHRSDESGTTKNFTDYMNQVAPSTWTAKADDVWPIKGQEAAEGTSGVVAAIKNGAGTIGYADASQARELGIAKVKVGGQYLEPTAEAASKILAESKKSSDPGKNVFTYEINRKAENAYPIVLLSYELACTKYDDASQAGLVKGYLSYIVSPEGQKAAAAAAGSAALTDADLTKYKAAVDAIQTS